MADTQLNGHQTVSDDGSLVSVRPGAGQERNHQGRPDLRFRRNRRLVQQKRGVPHIARRASQLRAVPGALAPTLPRTGQHIAPPPAAIAVTDLCKEFGTRKNKVLAVDHLSLSVRQGEVFGLLGPNGSGKTTTINMLCGLSKPTSGEIKIMGYDLRHQSRRIRQLLGSVPQETALYEELSAWQNMDFHAELFGIAHKRQRIISMLELVQLLDRKDDRVDTFSGGMKRRVALARALLHDPQLIYLDEPTLGVDVQARRAIWDYILSLREQGKTVLITTNYLEEAQALCDRVAIIDRGKLIAEDTPAHLKQEYGGSVIEVSTLRPSQEVDQLRSLAGVQGVMQEGTRLVITTKGGHHIAPQIINMLSQESELTEISIREQSLDEVFLVLTGRALRD